jgi:nucleotide-binding universal stress UspA family protein
MVPETFGKIVLPIDIQSETRQKVPVTATIAELFGSEIHVIEVASSHSAKVHKRLNAYSKQVNSYLKSRNIKIINHTLFGDNVADIAVTYADSIKADMISIIAEQKSSITNLILGNYAQQILNKAVIPVLNVTPKEIQIKGTFSTHGD